MRDQGQGDGLLGDTASKPQQRALIVHIGDHKTGTTSIQRALASGTLQLAGSSYFYKGPDQNHLAGQFRALTRGTDSEDGERARARVQSLADEMAVSDAPFAVISAENLEGIAPAAFREVLERYFSEHFDVIRVVAYVRPHAPRLLSSFAERTKIGTFYGDLDDFFRQSRRRNMIEYQPRFQAWREAFGDLFVLRPFIRGELLRKSAVDDFAAVAFPGLEFTVAQGEVQNESLSLEDLMRVKYVQQELLEAGVNQHAAGWVLHNLLADMPTAGTQTRLQIHRPLAKRISDIYREDALSMDRDFFGGKELFAPEIDKAIEAAPPRKQSCNPEDYFSPSELRSLRLLARFVPLLREGNRLRQREHLERLRHSDATPVNSQFQKQIRKFVSGYGGKFDGSEKKYAVAAKKILTVLGLRDRSP